MRLAGAAKTSDEEDGDSSSTSSSSNIALRCFSFPGFSSSDLGNAVLELIRPTVYFLNCSDVVFRKLKNSVSFKCRALG